MHEVSVRWTQADENLKKIRTYLRTFVLYEDGHDHGHGHGHLGQVQEGPLQVMDDVVFMDVHTESGKVF